jgi:hypothetical protein
MRPHVLLLALSLAATFVAFAAPPADACAPIQNCIPGCQYSCPPGCGDNIGCCQPGDSLVHCLVPTCTPRFCIDTPPVPCTTLSCLLDPQPICMGPVCVTLCTYLLGCPINSSCNNLYCWTPPPLPPLA